MTTKELELKTKRGERWKIAPLRKLLTFVCKTHSDLYVCTEATLQYEDPSK